MHRPRQAGPKRVPASEPHGYDGCAWATGVGGNIEIRGGCTMRERLQRNTGPRPNTSFRPSRTYLLLALPIPGVVVGIGRSTDVALGLSRSLTPSRRRGNGSTTPIQCDHCRSPCSTHASDDAPHGHLCQLAAANRSGVASRTSTWPLMSTFTVEIMCKARAGWTQLRVVRLCISACAATGQAQCGRQLGIFEGKVTHSGVDDPPFAEMFDHEEVWPHAIRYQVVARNMFPDVLHTVSKVVVALMF